MELNEIEVQLYRLDGVEQVAVVASENHLREIEVTAYMRVAEHCTLGTKAFIDKLATVLPDYMLPSRILIVDRIPVTVSGKVDREALKSMSHQKTTETKDPKTRTEKKVMEFWQHVFGVDSVSRDDDLITMGVSSLSASELCMQISDVFGVGISVHQLVLTPSVAQLSAYIESKR